MRWFTTFLLVLLVVAGGAWLWKGDDLAPKLGLPAPAADVDASEARNVLATQLTADNIRKIELTVPGNDPLVLTREKDGWAQPGNWPVRQEEAADLGRTLVSLKTLFRPIKLTGDAGDPKLYGFDASQKPVVAKVEIPGQTVTLTFGQPPATADEPATARPTYLQVNALPEVLRLPPDVMAELLKKPDAYRGKRLFPDAERVKITGGDPPFNPMAPAPPSGRAVPLLGDRYASVKVDGPDGGFVLKRVAKTPEAKAGEGGTIEPTIPAARLAGAWEVAEVAPPGDVKAFAPLRDKVDPAKVRAVLTAIPDLWAEDFIKGKTDAETGLDKPERTVSVTQANGSTVTLRIGKVSRSSTKVSAPPPASPFGQPPQPTITTEEFRYARLDNNPLVFEVRADKLNDLFAKPEDVRDAQLARFDTGDVTEVTVAPKGKPPVKLLKKKGNKDADRDEDKQDRWYVGDILAEPSRVTELLDQLGRLEAKGKDAVIDHADAKKLTDLGIDDRAGTKVTVLVQEKGEPGASATGGTTTPPKTFTFLLGKDDPEKKKVNVQLVGWPEVDVVDDAVVKLIDRPALAYRGRRLFDTAEAKLETVAVTQEGNPPFAFAKSGDKWAITEPVKTDADEAKASQLVGDLSRLEATEYVDDAPKPEDLDKKYGLAKPKLSAVLKFSGPGGKDQKLEIGNAPEFKSEYYARLNGGSVFTVAKTTIDSLKQGAVALLSQQLWSVAPEKFTALEVKRADGETYKLAPDGTDWKLTGPFEAKVPFQTAQPLLTALGHVRAEKYESLSAADSAKYGFDKPALRLTVTYKDGQPGKEAPVTKTLLVGKPGDAPNTRFAKVEGGPTQAVFTVPDTLAKEADKPALDLLDKGLLFLDPTKLTKLQITGPKPEDAVTLVKDDKGGWKAEGQSFAIDKPAADAAVNEAAHPVVKKLAGYGPAVKWADFGLEKPEYTLTATVAPPMGDNSPPKQHTIKLGKPAPDGGRYARVDDGPAVAVLDPIASTDLARGKLDFVDRTLLAFDVANLTGIVRKKGSEDLELAQGATAGWDITKPAKQKADAPLMEELADQLSRLRAVTVADYGKPDLKKYGLDSPAAVVTLKVGIEKPADTVLKLGKPVDDKQPNGDRYVVVEGKPETTVGVLAGPLAKRLLADSLKFRDRSLTKFVDADRVTVERGDRKATFAKVDGTWKMVKPVDAEAEQGDLDELVNALAKLRADELEADKPKDLKPYGLDKPEEKLILAAGDKEVLSLLVGSKEKDGPRVYAKLEKGDLVAALDPTLTAKVLGEYRKRAVWTGVDAAQVETIAVSSGASNFALRKVGTTWADTAKPTDPIDSAKVSEYLDALAGLKAERYVADKDADLKLYGLQPPERVIVLTQKGGVTKTLHLGRPEGGSNGKRVYAKVADAGRTDVFVLSEADTGKLTRDRAAFVGKK
jgi:hypothetical protein